MSEYEARAFFRRQSDALEWLKRRGAGKLYCNIPGHQTQQDYLYEAAFAGISEPERIEKPYCVVCTVIV